ncbi:MAG: hypothetical protein ACYC8T_20880 [Myxococcaceae bacterium]
MAKQSYSNTPAPTSGANAPSPENRTLFEAEGFGALERAAGHALAMGHALTEAANAFAAGGQDEIEKRSRRVAELLNLALSRLKALTRDVGAGGGA